MHCQVCVHSGCLCARGRVGACCMSVSMCVKVSTAAVRASVCARASMCCRACGCVSGVCVCAGTVGRVRRRVSVSVHASTGGSVRIVHVRVCAWSRARRGALCTDWRVSVCVSAWSGVCVWAVSLCPCSHSRASAFHCATRPTERFVGVCVCVCIVGRVCLIGRISVSMRTLIVVRSCV